MSGVFDPVYFDPAYFDTGEGGGEVIVPPPIQITGRYRAHQVTGRYAARAVTGRYTLTQIIGRWRAPE